MQGRGGRWGDPGRSPPFQLWCGRGILKIGEVRDAPDQPEIGDETDQ